MTGCTKPGVPQPAREEANRAAAFIASIEKDEAYRLGIRPEIENALAAAKLELHDLLKGCIELLRHGSASEKVQSARFLGRLGNPSVINPIVESLGDPDETVREAACYALQWLAATGKSVETPLARLCREDPSVAVRVAAAVALKNSNETDVVTAYQLGLKSTNSSLWQICEDELDKRGKLELPLPDHVYTEISQARYQQIKSDRWYWVQRETTRNGTVYLEVVERVHHVPLHRDWYKLKLGP
jgi:HEAT repeat protein